MNPHILTRLRALGTAAFLILAVWGCVVTSTTQAQPAEESNGALLLKNNRVLLGNVVRRGDLFVVEVANQSAVSLPKDQVDFVGKTIRDVYAYKIHCVPRWNVGEHFQLTRWCMANSMLDEAVLHYQEVAKQAGDHPRVKQLAMELKNRMLEVPEFRNYLGLSPLSMPSEQTAIAGKTAPVEALVVSASTALRVVQHPQIVRQFSERVQPILINRCSQAACHGSQTDRSFQLDQPYSRSSHETSSANLTSALGQVSDSSEVISPLMIYATKAHGVQRKPGIAVTETELIAELRRWIQFVQNPVVSAEASFAPNPLSSMRPVGTNASQTPSALNPVPYGTNQLKQVPQTPPIDANTPKPAVAGFPLGEAVPSDSELDALEAEINQFLGPTNPNDPFDPAEFNRQMGNVKP